MYFLGCKELPVLEEKGLHEIIEIVTFENVYDLHNAGEFLGFNYEVMAQIITLNWQYYNMKGQVDKRLYIVCSKISSFHVKQRDPEMPFSEDDCLKEIVYDKKSVNFIYMGGQEIKIFCGKFEFIVENISPGLVG